jgi:hypothetical protein
VARARPAGILIDEGEGLCGKRTEVNDAHDRYANMEIGHLP